VWASDGHNAFLLDLIRQPEQLELRLDLYDRAANTAIVYREVLPLDAFKVVGDTITMGSLKISPRFVSGSVNGINVSAAFDVASRMNAFIPVTLEDAVKDYVPNITSHYGALTTSAVVGGVSYARDLPLVYTTYTIKLGIDQIIWAMISAMQFAGSDLQVELVGTPVGALWMGTSYIRYQGKEHHNDNPFVLETKIHQPGEIVGTERIFGATIVNREIDVSINCRAPVSLFAMLDKEGKTQIHTTALGTCTAVVSASSGPKSTYSATGCLLERKATRN